MDVLIHENNFCEIIHTIRCNTFLIDTLHSGLTSSK